MKKVYISKLAILIIMLLGGANMAIAQTTCYSSVGTYNYTVPSGCNNIQVDLAGAQGGTGLSGSTGGKGGRVVAIIAVTPGNVLNIYVGGKGGSYTSYGTVYPGGANGIPAGGGRGGNGYSYGGAGGGSTDIRTGAASQLNTRIVVAGGGGGGGQNCGSNDYGGGGGGLTGANGQECGGAGSPGCQEATGATQTIAGVGGSCYCTPGISGAFGNGGDENTCSNQQGGGGGGGWYGGGGGAYGGGGGGSSYYGATGVTLVTSSQGYQANDGYACITPLLPTVLSSNMVMDFGYHTVGTTSTPFYTEISGQYLSPTVGTLAVSCPSGYEISNDGITWTTGTLTISYTGATFSGYKVFAHFIPGAPTVYNNYITVTGGGPAVPLNITVLGTGTTTVCSGTPTTGTPTITPNTGSSGTFFTLDLPGVTAATGLFYQWQSSPTGSVYTDIPGAVRKSYTFQGINNNTFYRCNVQCGTGSPTTSAVVTATMVPTSVAKPCSGIPAPGLGFVRTTPGCSPYLNTFYAVGATQDSAVVHQWQKSSDGLSFSNVSGATGSAINALVSATVYYRDFVTCKISGQSSYGPNLQAVLNPTPDPIAGISPVCTGSAAATTYSSTTPLGTWSSSNVGVATIDSVTGLLTGVGVTTGTATISYTLSTGCAATQAVTVNPSPAAITGSGVLCSKGGTTTLSDATPGVTWSSADGSIASVSGGLVTGVNVGSTSIIVKNSFNCTANTPVTVNLQPSAISGSSAVCAGSGTALADADGPGVWTSNNAFNASVTGSTGFVTGVTAGSTATITYTIVSGGCFVTKNISVNTLPPAITGTTTVCAGNTVSLSNTASGTWSSSLGSTATVSGSGVVTGVNAGTATITFTANGTLCQVSTPVTVNKLPNVFAVTGSGSYCQGSAGASVGLSSSNSNVTYSLYKNHPLVLKSSLLGSSSALDFGMVDSGMYTVVASDIATNCVNNMAGSAILTVNPLPTQYLFYSNALSYCVGTSGVDFKMANTDGGVNYSVEYGPGNAVIKTTGGTGGTNTDLGFYKTPGSYIVIATDGHGCQNIMNGSPISISVDSLPKAFSVSNNGPAYCAGSAGVDIQLPASQSGVSYFLVKNGIPLAGDTILSTGSVVDFGNQTSAGTYVVKGLSSANCVNTMTNTVPLTVNPLPTPEPVTGGGGFCTGTAGVHVGVAYAFSGINYYLVNTASPFDTVASGGGANSSLDFGTINKPGVYGVIGKSAVGCTNLMTGTQTVTQNTPPVAGNVIGGGGYCAGSTGSTISLTPVQAGKLYRVYRTGSTPTLVETKTGGSGSLTFGPYTTTGTYYITGTDPVTGCTTQMNSTAVITLNPLPTAYKVFAEKGGDYCANDTAKHIMTTGSQLGTKYTLMMGTVPVGIANGTGDSVDFGQVSVPGVYYVVAKDNATSCSQNLLSTATISIDPLPTQYTVSVPGTNSYCAGGAGLHVVLSGSNTGINYQLMNGGTPIGSPLGGVSKGLDFGFQTTGGAYSVIAKNTTTGCTDTMLGTGTINVIALPTTYNVASQSPTYCPGGTGVDVFLVGSSSADKYYLYQGTTLLASKKGGASPLDFGNQTIGSYTVVAIDTTYGCQKTMSGTATISYRKVPTAYNVTGTNKSYCPVTSPTGVPVMLSFSDTGVKYEIYKGSTVQSQVFGGRAAINFGNQTYGVYTVKATDTTTTCTNIMTDTAFIAAAVPDTLSVNVTRNKNVVCEHDTATFTASPVNGGAGAKYQWLVNHSYIAGATSKNYKYVPTSKDDTVNVVVISVGMACVTPGSIYSSDTQGYIKATPTVTSKIQISTANTTLCSGGTGAIAFTIDTMYAGTAPGFKWEKNGKPASSGFTTSASYSTPIVDSDVIFCIMRSNADCPSDTFVYSNPITMRVRDVVTPAITLDVQPGIYVDKGTPVTFTAFLPLTDDSLGLKLYYSYQWYKNGQAITGATGGTYTTSDMVNGDNISCTVTSHDVCGTAKTSANQYMGIGTLEVRGAASNNISDVRIMPNPNKGVFTVKGTLNSVADQEVNFEVTNMLGQVVYSAKAMATGGKVDHEVRLSGSLANGMYLLSFNAGTDRQVFHFVVEN